MKSSARLLVATFAVLVSSSVPSLGGVAKASSATNLSDQNVCGQAVTGQFSCMAVRVLNNGQPVRPSLHRGITPALSPAISGFGPADFQSAYGLPSTTNGVGMTVAVVDAYNNPNAESDLAAYRSQYGQPACTTANGCFKKLDQNGGTNYPANASGGNSGWGIEIDLDLDAVSAACPNCHIDLIEANTDDDDLFTAVQTAVSVENANVVSMSWGGSEDPSETSVDSIFDQPGVAMVAATGDDGYGTSYPAASPYVTAAGGTHLVHTGPGRGWTESVWNGTGSGCSSDEAKPSWQTDTGCAGRMLNDVSADADPNTGAAVYDTFGQGNSGWEMIGGTSLSTPLIAGVYALAGGEGNTTGAEPFYSGDLSSVYPVSSGNNGSCSPAYFCTAGISSGPGWSGTSYPYSGPAGLGTPNGSAIPRESVPVLPTFTGNNEADLVAVNTSNSWAMTSTGSNFNAPSLWSGNSFYGNRATLSGDVDGDGKTDLVAINNDSVWVMLSTGSGFGPPQRWSSVPFYGTRATLVGDVSGDGKADLIAVNDTSVWVMKSTGSGFGPPQQWSATPFYGSQTTLAGDVTGGGTADLVAFNGDSVWVLPSTGSAFSAPALWSSSPFTGDVTTIVGDVTGDGRADLVAVNSSSVWVMPSSGQGFDSPELWSSVPFYGSSATLAGDVNNDGTVDLIAVNPNNTFVMTSTSFGFSAPTAWSSVPFTGNRAVIAG